ncbi:MAG: MMPL family transporter [Verrucomicrobiae bacterium]|nr:MMPL family transporter [Verrucomicrobiae bacterium]
MIGGVLGLTVIFGLAIPGLKISSSYRDLMPSAHPELQKYDAFLEDFGAANDLIVVLEGEPDEIREAATELADRLMQRGAPVADVFYRIDLETMASRLPLFLDVSTLDTALEQATSFSGTMEALKDAKGLPEVLDSLSVLMQSEDEGAKWDPATASQSMAGLTWFFKEWETWLTHREHHDFSVPAVTGAESGNLKAAREFYKGKGFLGSRDFRMVFLFVRPDRTSDDPGYLKTVENVVREEWAALTVSEEAGYGAITMGLTGMPAHILTDIESMRGDLLRAGVPSAVLVLIILWIGLGSIRRTLISLVPLTCGMVISLGVIRFLFDSLNRMSVSFLAIMFGIGIDFAIYLIRRTDEELAQGMDRQTAVRKALERSGQGIIAGGLVTALAFSVTAVSEFRGTSQLGLTTAVSVVIVLVVTLILLPAMLLRTREPGRPVAKETANRSVGKPGWRLSRSATGIALLFVTAVAVLGAVVAPRVPMDFNGLSVMPRDAESTEYQLKMDERSDFQMTSAVIQAENRQTLDQLVERVRALPTVARVVSLSDLIPQQQAEKIALLQTRQEWLEGGWPQLEGGESTDDYLTALTNFEDALLEAQELAFVGGQAELTEALQDGIDAVGSARAAFQAQPQIARSRTREFEHHLQGLIDQLSGYAKAWAKLAPFDESDLPPAFVKRFRSESGRYAAFVYPTGSVWDSDFLDTFLAELRSVDPGVTGYPVISQSNIQLLVQGIGRSLLLTLVVVIILLAIDLKRPAKVFYALCPLVVGMAMLQAWLYLTGQSYNLASINGLPLLLGLGVVYGVHLVHRWAEHPELSAFHAVKTSGRAIALAGVTTMAGLASLTLCIHQGVATFGGLLLQGIVCMLLASLIALPLAIDWFSRSKSAGSPD